MAGHTGSDTGAHPSVQHVVGWLLETPPDHPDPRAAIIVAAETAYGQLRARLVISLGDVGFDALWARAIRLALQPATMADMLPGRSGPPALRTLVQDRDAAATAALLVGIFTRFFDLLVTFIGEPLMIRIITELWPTLPTPVSDSIQRKEVDHDEI